MDPIANFEEQLQLAREIIRISEAGNGEFSGQGLRLAELIMAKYEFDLKVQVAVEQLLAETGLEELLDS